MRFGVSGINFVCMRQRRHRSPVGKVHSVRVSPTSTHPTQARRMIPPSLVRGTPTIPAGSDERRPPQPSVSRVSAAPQSSLCCPGQEVEASAGGRGQSLHHYTRGLGISGLILIVHWVGGWNDKTDKKIIPFGIIKNTKNIIPKFKEKKKLY